MKMCSWWFIHWRLECRRFIPFLRFVHENLKRRFFPWIFVHGDLSFENLNRRFIPWRFVHGDLSFEDLFGTFFLLKICSWRFVLWRFVQEIFSFEILFWRFVLLKKLADLSFENFLGDLSFWIFDFRRFFLFEKCFRRFILLKLFLEIYTFKNFVFKIYPFKILGDLSFW